MVNNMHIAYISYALISRILLPDSHLYNILLGYQGGCCILQYYSYRNLLLNMPCPFKSVIPPIYGWVNSLYGIWMNSFFVLFEGVSLSVTCFGNHSFSSQRVGITSSIAFIHSSITHITRIETWAYIFISHIYIVLRKSKKDDR